MNELLKGNKVYLRPPLKQDIEVMFSWENDPANWRVSNTRTFFSKESIEQFIAAGQDIFLQHQLRLMICRIDNDEAVGAIDLFDYDGRHQYAGVGILIDEKHRRKGYAAAGLEILKRYALNEIGIRNLFANILVDNGASIRLFEKAGFEKAGYKKNWFNDNGNWIDELFYQAALTDH